MSLVLLVERRRTLRNALLAESRLREIKFVHRGSIAAAVATTDLPHAVFLDVTCDDSVGRAIARTVHRFSTVPVVAVGPRDPKAIVTAIKSGAAGYLFSDEPAGRFVAAVLDVVDGGLPFSGDALRLVIARARRDQAQLAPFVPPSPSKAVHLSPAQKVVLSKLFQGLSYEQIALELGNSINTVRTHVRVIYERLEVNSKADAIRAGLRLGILES